MIVHLEADTEAFLCMKICMLTIFAVSLFFSFVLVAFDGLDLVGLQASSFSTGESWLQYFRIAVA